MKKYTLLAVSIALGLSACNSDSETNDTAQVSFDVSDAPVDAANAVLVCFDSVELVGNGLPPQNFNVGDSDSAVPANDLCLDETGNVIPGTVGIDLLTLQGADSAALVQNAEVPAGNYGQLRLNFVSQGSYVELTDGSRQPLDIPSDQLRLDGVTLTANQSFNYTLEFDLRRALVAPPGLPNYLLKPRGLRLVDNASVGHLDGEIAEMLLIENECSVAPADNEEAVAAVYLFEGQDVAIEDMFSNSDEVSPYASISVFYDGVSQYPLSIGFIEAGQYTLGLTCDTNDDPEEETELTFIHAQNVTIEQGQTLEVVIGE
ncbi:hypothetical protein CWE09_10840 [Aliidiomarina minuta]|uniref:DUF4382 domain-containing protein n=1 Tax=Aliidiomarina minuta TaxID=880057 RepID=A0A432W4C9_9GAMM|nr:DUF4382 domain-containing protein [Aliidiomarina minuta]RUO24362.1 hypothetical protein CWE09_10840 [Aliidiomarina minuta]